MEIKRRSFLAGSGAALGLAGADLGVKEARAQIVAAARSGTMTGTVCPCCALGCGAILFTSRRKLKRVEGDPDHPINRGALCAKGSALAQVADNPRRVTKVKYRAAGAAEWEEKDWDWALRRIARLVQKTRDAAFTPVDAQGRTVNRTEAIACLGGAALSNEEGYALGKLARALGLVYLEHEAAADQRATIAGLGASFGWGAATSPGTDVAGADCVLIVGADPAASQPVVMKWVGKAQQRGATIICLDPRFTRTSSACDIHAPLRAGTDLALVGCLIRHALEHGPIHREYLVAHTDAGFLIDPDFALEDGRFGPIADGRYTREHWGFQHDDEGRVKIDPSLEDPHCVFQVLKRHYARYTPESVARVCGTPLDTIRQVAEAVVDTGRPDRAGTILYGTGATRHPHGTQNVRGFAILQLLLGNVGIAGGGVHALGAEANAQGATDHGLLGDLLPGHLKCPSAGQATLAAHVAAGTPSSADPQSANGWSRYSACAVSLLKAWWGPHANRDNQFAYDYLPKHDTDGTPPPLSEAMERQRVRGLLAFRHNPAVTGPDAGRMRRSLEKLDWLVAVDLWENETATFWKRPGTQPEDVPTEVFLLPAAAHMEKPGSMTNASRCAQWRGAGIDPPGEARSDLWILDRLARQLQSLYAEGGVFPEPIVHLAWEYGDAADPEEVAREINGRFLAEVEFDAHGKRFHEGEPVPSPVLLRDDGTTAAGNWLYCGSFTGAGNQMARRSLSLPDRDPHGLRANWGWSWPANRRVLCNRAGCDASGRPWNEASAVVAYDPEEGRWRGDVPDGAWPPPRNPDGSPHPDGKHAFLMLPEGRACLFAPGLVDGPLPEHYEPPESPVANLLSPQNASPLARAGEAEALADPAEYPIVAITCQVGEHAHGGATTRNLPWLAELVPCAFVELSRSLAEAKGIEHGDRVAIRSPRGRIVMPALVTGRLEPLEVDGRRVEQVAIVERFGYEGLATGPSAGVLTACVGGADALVPESTAFLCNVEKEADGHDS